MSDVIIVTSYPTPESTSVFVDGKHLKNVTAIGVGQSADGYPDVVIEVLGEATYDEEAVPELADADRIMFNVDPTLTDVKVGADFLKNILGIRFSQSIKTIKEFEILFSPSKPVIITIDDSAITWQYCKVDKNEKESN
jgi:hypothetical protein